MEYYDRMQGPDGVWRELRDNEARNEKAPMIYERGTGTALHLTGTAKGTAKIGGLAAKDSYVIFSCGENFMTDLKVTGGQGVLRQDGTVYIKGTNTIPGAPSAWQNGYFNVPCPFANAVFNSQNMILSFDIKILSKLIPNAVDISCSRNGQDRMDAINNQLQDGRVAFRINNDYETRYFEIHCSGAELICSNFMIGFDENYVFVPAQNRTEIQIDPGTDSASIATYDGETNIWNNAGVQMAVEYPMDTKYYIDKKIEELRTAMLAQGAGI